MFSLEVYPSPENFTWPLVAMVVTFGMSASRSTSCPLASSGSCFYVISIHQIYLMISKPYIFGKCANNTASLSTVAIYYFFGISSCTHPAWSCRFLLKSCCQSLVTCRWPSVRHSQLVQQSTAIDKESWDYTQHSYHPVWKQYVKKLACLVIVIRPS